MEFSDISLVNNIVEQIAFGENTLNTIAGKCITDEKNKKKTQYVLRDYMFKFWYEFIPKATSVIEMGQGEIYYQDTQSGLKHYQKRMYCCLH